MQNEIKKLINNSDLLTNPVYQARLNEELTLIEQLGQTENILLALEIKKIIQSFTIPFFIRGSAGGSLVLFLLGFTTIDPVKNNILFERFINIHRDTLGDIDFDLPRKLRDKIMEKVFHVFSKKNIMIGRLCTRVYYRHNSAIREILRRLNIRTTIPKEIMQDTDVFKQFLSSHNINYDTVISKAKEIENTLRYTSAHVGGITVMKDDEKWIIKKDVKSKQIPLVHLDKNDVDEQKRFKIDLLSNSGLDIIREIYPVNSLAEHYFPYEQNVFDMIGKGDVIGLIYGESPLLKSVFQTYHAKHKIQSIEDIAKCISIIRPMGRGQGKEGLYSELIFDDDYIIALANILNVSYSDADKQRKKLAKDDPELVKKLKKLIPPQRLKQLMQIKQYGFCKAHAMNYAQLIYCQAYAKFHKPHEFFCAVLNNLNGRVYADWVYFFDALKHGIKIFATKKNDKYIVKSNKNNNTKHIQPSSGIQPRLFSMSPSKEIKSFGGFTSLINTHELNHIVACSRHWKDYDFRTILLENELVNQVNIL